MEVYTINPLDTYKQSFYYNDISEKLTYKVTHNLNMKKLKYYFDYCINGRKYDLTNAFEKINETNNSITFSFKYTYVKNILKELESKNSVITLTLHVPNKNIFECNNNLDVKTLQPKRQWMEERYYKIVHILNKSKTISVELLKECEWLAGELLKDGE